MTITSAAGVEFARELGCSLVVLARECSLQEIEQNPRRPAAAPAGGVCPWRVVRRLFRPMLDKRGAGRPLRQSRRVRPGLPHALRFDLRRPAGSAGRPPLSVKPAGSGRLGSAAGFDPRRRGFAENRRAGSNPPNTWPTSRRFTGARWTNYGRGRTRRRSAAPGRRHALRSGNGFFARAAHGLVWRHQQSGVGPRPFWQKTRRLSGHGAARGRRSSSSPAWKPRSRPATALYLTPAGPTKRKRAAGSMGSNRRPPGSEPVRLRVLGFGRGDVDFSRIHIGDRLWKTSDPELDRRLRQSFAGQTPHFRRPLSLEVHGARRAAADSDRARRTGARRPSGISLPLAVAEKQPLTTEKLRGQLGRLGGTVFQLGALRNLLEGEVILPASELNRMRRELGRQDWKIARAADAMDRLRNADRRIARLKPAARRTLAATGAIDRIGAEHGPA